MALNIKVDGKAVIQKIGIPQDMFDWLDGHCTVQTSKTGIHITMLDGSNEQTIPMSVLMFTQVQSGTLSMLLKTQLREAITGAITKMSGMQTKSLKIKKLGSTPAGAMAKLPPLNAPATSGDSGIDDAADVLKKAFGDKVLDLHQLSSMLGLPLLTANPSAKVSKEVHTTVVNSAGWPLYPIDQLQTGELIKLRDAAQMYQPVSGTSGGSRYFLVAGNPKVKVACRWQNDTLSIRVEGPSWTDFTKQIKDCGIDNISGDYASVHLKCGNLMLAKKALGAVLGGLSLSFETPVPNLEVLAG